VSGGNSSGAGDVKSGSEAVEANKVETTTHLTRPAYPPPTCNVSLHFSHELYYD